MTPFVLGSIFTTSHKMDYYDAIRLRQYFYNKKNHPLRLPLVFPASFITAEGRIIPLD